MFRRINANKLRHNIWRKGPFIVYFNGGNIGLDQKIISNIESIAHISYFVNVLEIDLFEYLEFENVKSFAILNNVTLFYYGKFINTLPNPNKDQIHNIFEQAKQLYQELTHGNSNKISQNVNKTIQQTKINKKSIYMLLNQEQKKRKLERSRLSFMRKRKEKYG